MSTSHDTFSRSSHGMFRESAHRVRGGGGGVIPVSGRILVWRHGPTSLFPVAPAISDTLAQFGLDTDQTWSGDLDDYGLIFVLPNIAGTPSWWSLIETAQWSGRVFMPGRVLESINNGSYFIDRTSGVHGMTVVEQPEGIVEFLVPYFGTTTSHPLAAGEDQITHGSVRLEVSGGTVVCFTGEQLRLPLPTPVAPFPVMAEKTVGNISFVAFGDEGIGGLGQTIIRNLYTVPV